jgi:allantoicase
MLSNFLPRIIAFSLLAGFTASHAAIGEDTLRQAAIHAKYRDGSFEADWSRAVPGRLVDLASMAWGGKALASNDAFFSSRDNINLPYSSRRMDDGWETRRRRSYNASADGGDWLLLRLGKPGTIMQAMVETHHFKGNPPDRVRLEALNLPRADAATALASSAWRTLLPDQPMEPHQTHVFHKELAALGVVTHVRMVINPDGGVSRLRLLAVPADAEGEK